jgi:hypothetical protein
MGASWKLQKPNLPTRNLLVSTRKLESTAYEAIAMASVQRQPRLA